MVPERGFAFTMLTNSDGGEKLHNDLFVDDWALRRFAGISNLPAVPRALTPGELAPYEGHYGRKRRRTVDRRRAAGARCHLDRSVDAKPLGSDTARTPATTDYPTRLSGRASPRRDNQRPRSQEPRPSK
jgi:hypothetical protein